MAVAQRTGILNRVEGLPIIVVFALMLALFMAMAPEVFLRKCSSRRTST
jgi:hypothetical protein